MGKERKVNIKPSKDSHFSELKKQYTGVNTRKRKVISPSERNFTNWRKKVRHQTQTESSDSPSSHHIPAEVTSDTECAQFSDKKISETELSESMSSPSQNTGESEATVSKAHNDSTSTAIETPSNPQIAPHSSMVDQSGIFPAPQYVFHPSQGPIYMSTPALSTQAQPQQSFLTEVDLQRIAQIVKVSLQSEIAALVDWNFVH